MRSRTKEKERDVRGPLESASFPRIGANPATPTVGKFNKFIEYLIKGSAAPFPLMPTKFWSACDNCRRCPSCGPYAEWVNCIRVFSLYHVSVDESYRNKPERVECFSWREDRSDAAQEHERSWSPNTERPEAKPGGWWSGSRSGWFLRLPAAYTATRAPRSSTEQRRVSQTK